MTVDVPVVDRPTQPAFGLTLLITLLLGSVLILGFIAVQGFRDRAATARLYAEQVTALTATERAALQTADARLATLQLELHAMTARVARTEELRAFSRALITCTEASR